MSGFMLFLFTPWGITKKNQSAPEIRSIDKSCVFILCDHTTAVKADVVTLLFVYNFLNTIYGYLIPVAYLLNSVKYTCGNPEN